MNAENVAKMLAATVAPERELATQAEAQLEEMQKIIGFPGILLQLAMGKTVDQSVKQAGAIMLKNHCHSFWADREITAAGDSAVNFVIHENDKAYIRENIVESIIASNELLRNQLTVIANHIIKHDYPHKFPEVNEKILAYLQERAEPAKLMGSLLVLYQIVKCFEYKSAKEREPLIMSMKVFLPIIQEMIDQLSAGDNNEASILLQKQILKIFFALTQYTMPLALINAENFATWMEILIRIIGMEVPPFVDEYDECDRAESAWWKVKKWCCHVASRIFERYGSPGNVDEQYQEFANFWLKNYSIKVMAVQLQLLQRKKDEKYIAPRVLQQILNYVETAVGHAQTWKILKNVYSDMLIYILFPLLCFSEDDKDLWEDDPQEFIRSKFDVFEDFISPNTAAQTVLHTACSKRKQVLEITINFCSSKIQDGCKPQEQDGVLHIIGSVADALMKKKPFKDQMEGMLRDLVLPAFTNQEGYIRARACWVVQQCAHLKFKSDDILKAMADCVRGLLLNQQEHLPVRVEAAIALNQFVCQQHKIAQYMTQSLKEILEALLFLINETENDELTDVVRKIICYYCEEIAPFAVEMADKIVATFLKVIDNDDEDTSDDRAITAVGLLNTLETMLDVVDQEKSIMARLEGIVCRAIAHVLANRIMDYYEEVLSLLYSITCNQVSAEMWQALELIHNVFNDDGFDFFTEMMPCLHNFLVNDTQVFLSNPRNLEIVFSMCCKVLTSDCGEDPESHAAKLLECIVIQCRSQVTESPEILTRILAPALERLTKEIKTPELRQMCLQVVVSAMLHNPELVLRLLNEIRFPNSPEPIGAEQFVRKWLGHIEDFTGIHDRRVCIFGLCNLLLSSSKPPCVIELRNEMLPNFIHLFTGLKKAVMLRDEGDDEEEEDAEIDDSDEELEEIDDDADLIDSDNEYKDILKDIDAGDESLWEAETGLETFQTDFDDEEKSENDEYLRFCESMQTLDAGHKELYHGITEGLTNEFRDELMSIMNLAEERRKKYSS
ncbi:unnamed protein product [Oikopleura dioica]|uniref:Importin N-terminal domain-containing protein n=1 Tax=Oikopleura dioica TaxID=34765 RepID=E4YVW0_OIKDI|nr:unnamed protein product [Oikopleura dioica]